MKANASTDRCYMNKPFASPGQNSKRHFKRRCCEVPPTKFTLPRVTQQVQLSMQSHAGDSAAEASQQQHPTPVEPQLSASIADCLKPYITAESKWWPWKYNSRIHYRQQGSVGPCILLVHGFGVGAFHFDQLIQKLSAGYQVWAVDLLGQGMSWPAEEPPQGACE